MGLVTPTLAERVAAVAADHRSGASALLSEAILILEQASRHDRKTLITVASSLCTAQPSMASFWNAAALALRQDDDGTGFSRLANRTRRGQDSLTRFVVDLLLPTEDKTTALVIITVSASSTVRRCLEELARRVQVEVVCAEGRPLYEGRDLAAALSMKSIPATVCIDAAVGTFLDRANVVLMGADAVSSEWFLNKCGSSQVVATANAIGVPVYVVASRDKFIRAPLADMLRPGDGPTSEVWRDAPKGVTVANPYFEYVPISSVAAVVTDVGTVGPDSVGDVCNGVIREVDAIHLATAIKTGT